MFPAIQRTASGRPLIEDHHRGRAGRLHGLHQLFLEAGQLERRGVVAFAVGRRLALAPLLALAHDHDGHLGVAAARFGRGDLVGPRRSPRSP